MKKNDSKLKITFITILFFGIFSLAESSLAAPVISDVFGTIQNNNTITITGTGFGTKVTSTPAYYSNFETETGVPTGWIAGGANPGAVSTDRSHAGAKSLLFDISTTVENFSRQIKYDMGVGDTFYITAWVYIDNTLNTATQYQFKSWRLSSDVGAYSISETPSTTVALNDNWWRTTGWFNEFSWSYYNGGAAYGCGSAGAPTDQFLFNQWQRVEEVLVRSSPAGTPNGSIIHRRVGRANPISSIVNCVTHDSADDKQWRYMMLGQAVSNVTSGTGHLKIYYDDLYVDHTQARIEIGNNSNYASSTIKEVQLPINWTDNTIEVTLNQGVFSNSDNAYVYVVDSNGAVSSSYGPVTFSGTDTTPPASPTGLNVN